MCGAKSEKQPCMKNSIHSYQPAGQGIAQSHANSQNTCPPCRQKILGHTVKIGYVFSRHFQLEKLKTLTLNWNIYGYLMISCQIDQFFFGIAFHGQLAECEGVFFPSRGMLGFGGLHFFTPFLRGVLFRYHW